MTGLARLTPHRQRLLQGLATGSAIYVGGALLVWAYARANLAFLASAIPTTALDATVDAAAQLRPGVGSIGLLMLVVTAFAALFTGGTARDHYGIAGLLLTLLMVPTVHRLALVASLAPQPAPGLNPLAAPLSWSLLGVWLPLLVGGLIGWWAARNAQPIL
jgi:predicted anti-sigma-YlaC factor YlaD